jgi:hypothetical protein
LFSPALADGEQSRVDEQPQAALYARRFCVFWRGQLQGQAVVFRMSRTQYAAVTAAVFDRDRFDARQMVFTGGYGVGGGFRSVDVVVKLPSLFSTT